MAPGRQYPPIDLTFRVLFSAIPDDMRPFRSAGVETAAINDVTLGLPAHNNRWFAVHFVAELLLVFFNYGVGVHSGLEYIFWFAVAKFFDRIPVGLQIGLGQALFPALGHICLNPYSWGLDGFIDPPQISVVDFLLARPEFVLQFFLILMQSLHVQVFFLLPYPTLQFAPFLLAVVVPELRPQSEGQGGSEGLSEFGGQVDTFHLS